MSQKHPYTIRGDDFQSHEDMHGDSYQRQSSMYRPSVRSLSQEQTRSTTFSNRTVDSSVQLPGALSFLYSCGLDSSDIAHLAEIPEHLFTAETLSSLLSQIKERKLSRASTSSSSSSRPSTSQTYDTLNHAWEGSTHTTSVEYPIDRPAPPVYPAPPKQGKTWQDCWENPRQRSSSRSSSSSVPDYNVYKNTIRDHRAKVSQGSSSRSFIDSRPKPLLSLKLEPPVVEPTRKETSDFHCKIPHDFPHVCHLCDISVCSTKDWFSHVRGNNNHVKSQLDLLKRNESFKVYKVPTKTEASDFNGIAPPVFPYLCVLCNITVFSEKRCSRVVSFIPLPVGEGIATELTAIAKRFGSVRKCLFLPNRGYVEMGCLSEARKLVEHYSANQLKIKGKLIQVTYSCDYNSLRQVVLEAEGNCKPSLHTQRRSPSPRRRRSSERSRSSPKRKSSSERNYSSTKRKRSPEMSHSSGSPGIKDKDNSKKFKANDSTSVQPYRSSGSAAKATTTNNNNVEGLNVNSDRKGLEVGAELAHEPTTSDQRNLPSELMDVTDNQLKEKDITTGNDSPNDDPSEAPNSQKEDQKFIEVTDHVNKSTAEPKTSENPKDSAIQPKEERVDLKETCKVLEVRSLAIVEDNTEEAPLSRKSEEQKPSAGKVFSAPQKYNSKVNNEHRAAHNNFTTKTLNVELKTAQKVNSDINVAPIESSSVASSAGVCKKSQKPTEAPTPPTESVKQPENTTTDALGPYEPNVPVGVEFVKMGYYCRVCQLFYSSEKAAKKVHCSSQAHFEKLKFCQPCSMSQKYPYTISGDDFQSHQDMYADSYQRHCSTYQPSAISSSQEQTCSTTSSNRPADSTAPLTGMALSFLHSCGLDSDDLADLAELPEHLITVETLPQLLLQVKERKLSRASSTRPSTSQPLDNTSAHAWESSSHTTLVKYPIDCPDQPSYPLPPEQVQTWQDRWGNPRRMSTLTTGGSSSKSSSIPDYSISQDSYRDTTKSPEPSSHTFVDFGPRPLLSLKLEPPIVTPTRKEASDFNGKIPPDFPHLCRLCDFTVHSTKDWLVHIESSEHADRQLDFVKNCILPSPLGVSKCDDCCGKAWSAHVSGVQHAKSQLKLMERRSPSPKRHSADRTRRSPKERDSSDRTRCSPKRRGSSDRTRSSPKRKRSAEMTHSSPKRKRSAERIHSSPKRWCSSDRTHSSPKRRHLTEKTYTDRSNHVKEQEDSQNFRENDGTDHCSNAETEESRADTEKKIVCTNNVDSVDSDSDLEGVEVIADDGEELAHDIDDYEPATSEGENLPSEPMEVTNVHTTEEVNTGDNSPNYFPSEAPNSLIEGKKFEDHEDVEIKEEDHDFPNILENCVTLDEFTAENSLDCPESEEAKPSIPQTEDSSGEATTSTNPVMQSDNEPEAPKEESVSKEKHDTERVTDDLKESFGKVLEVKNLPNAEDYTDVDFLNIIQRYGDVTCHVLFPSCKKESTNNHKNDALNGNTDPANEPAETDEPVGTEFVRPVVGYFCNLCNVIYASEEEAKDEHCRSLSHRKKVKDHKDGSVKK
ncbi:Matrin-3 [Bagarius yarrelli]|uniref:Matrin-3 n=1 Tax=Bagarius yarrelli TaxID=175774 RepID=A0A556TNN8_BAGYA|nr:Matrin-3 [Bagarius yarrelli]